jgi:type I restriction enzyme S subunit
MKKYPAYKNSGVEMLEKIPTHWHIKRLKRLAKICNGQDQKNVTDENGEYPVIGTGGVFGKANKYLHKGHSVILGRKGTIDNPLYIETPFWSVDTAYYTEIKSTTHPKFFFYCTKTIKFDLYKYGSAVPSMTQETLHKIEFAVPEFQEQSQIASFLDHKTHQIDDLIAKKQKLIELLKEERNALINHAVTKGLDPAVPMKNSGIIWLGEIPEHWELRKIGRSFKIIGSGTTPTAGREEFYQNGSIPWVLTGDLNDNFLFQTSKSVTEKAFEDHSALKKFPAGSLVIAMYGATIGRLSILEIEATTNQACCVLADSNFFSIRFLFYWFLSNRNNIISLSYGGGQPNISQEIIRNIKVPCPTIKEQSDIVKFIDNKCNAIDTSLLHIEKEIELITEYKTSLINEAVTGKIDVRENNMKPTIFTS